MQEVISKPRQFCFDTALRVQDKKRAPGAPRNGTSLSLGPVAWGVSAKEPGAAVVGSAHPRAPSSALPRLRPEWRQGQGWKEDEIQGGGGGVGSPTSGCVTRVAMATPFTLQGPAGAGGGRGRFSTRAAADSSGPGSAAPHPLRAARLRRRGPAPARLPGEPSPSVPAPVLSPDTARQHGPGERGVPGGTRGGSSGRCRRWETLGSEERGARSGASVRAGGEDTASFVGFW